MKTTILLALAAFVVAPMPAQLATPNSMGAAAGHIHLNVQDIEAQQKFWAHLDGKPMNNEKLVMVQFPGVFIILRKQDSSGGTVGSVVNHIGFHVKDINAWLPKWTAAGIKIERANNPKQAFLTAPDDVRVEILEDSSIAAPIEFHHIHLFVPDSQAAQAWYGKNFGAIAGKRAQFDIANVPGAEITFTKDEKPQAPSKGRSVDHIGFEVKNIDAVVKRLEAAGIMTDAPVRTSANASKLRITYIMDPWGTNIELTEGLTPQSSSASR